MARKQTGKSIGLRCVTHFFSCDWGTTSFRLRRVNVDDGRIVEERSESIGVKALHARCPAGDRAAREAIFAGFLRERLGAMTAAQPTAAAGAIVMISGMAASSVGWRELPHALLPVGLDGADIPRAVFPLELADGAAARIELISGVRSATDMMRGEEVEILGLFAEGRRAGLADDGLVVLPGTHSKHVRLHGRQMVGIRTYLTGELFEVLAKHSILSASLAPAEARQPLTDVAARAAFLDGVQAASANGLAASLFQTRIRTVLQDVPAAQNHWFLSGLLIGAEGVDLLAREPKSRILLAAPEPLNVAYALAFEALGLGPRVEVAPPDEMSLASVRGQLRLLRAGLPATEQDRR